MLTSQGCLLLLQRRWFNSPYPLGSSQLSGIPVIGDLTFSSGLLGNQAFMWCTCMYLSQYTFNKSKTSFYSKNTEYVLGSNWYFFSVTVYNIFFGCILYANMMLIVCFHHPVNNSMRQIVIKSTHQIIKNFILIFNIMYI